MKSMRKVISSWFFTIVFLLLGVPVLSRSFDFNGYQYSVNADGKTVALTSGNTESTGTVIVPDYAYDTNGVAYPVTIVEDGAFRNFSGSKVVIGDNVTMIGEKAFQHFAQKGSDCVLILGKRLTSMPKIVLQHFGQGGSNNMVIIKCERIPSMDKQALGHVKNTTFVFRDPSTCQQYKSDETWKGFDGKDGNQYAWPFPYEREIQGRSWVTVVFPMDISAKDIISYFGAGTQVAYLGSSQYDSEKNEFHVHFAKTTKIKANTPYLLKIGNVESDFVCEVKGDPVATTLTTSVPVDSKPDYQAQMVGVFSPYTLAENEFYLRNQGGNLAFYVAKNDGTSFINANRCYFRFLDDGGQLVDFQLSSMDNNEGTQAAKMSALFEGGEATAIKMAVSQPHPRKGVYDIHGQYVGENTEKLAKGIYIVNGRKVIVK